MRLVPWAREIAPGPRSPASWKTISRRTGRRMPPATGEFFSIPAQAGSGSWASATRGVDIHSLEVEARSPSAERHQGHGGEGRERRLRAIERRRLMRSISPLAQVDPVRMAAPRSSSVLAGLVGTAILILVWAAAPLRAGLVAVEPVVGPGLFTVGLVMGLGAALARRSGSTLLRRRFRRTEGRILRICGRHGFWLAHAVFLLRYGARGRPAASSVSAHSALLASAVGDARPNEGEFASVEGEFLTYSARLPLQVLACLSPALGAARPSPSRCGAVLASPVQVTQPRPASGRLAASRVRVRVRVRAY